MLQLNCNKNIVFENNRIIWTIHCFQNSLKGFGQDTLDLKLIRPTLVWRKWFWSLPAEWNNFKHRLPQLPQIFNILNVVGRLNMTWLIWRWHGQFCEWFWVWSACTLYMHMTHTIRWPGHKFECCMHHIECVIRAARQKKTINPAGNVNMINYDADQFHKSSFQLFH